MFARDTLMPTLFRICRSGSPAKWTILLGDQTYGEYLNKNAAVTDAIEAAAEAREAGCAAEVWEDALRLY